MASRVIIVGDAHIDEKQSLTRFKALGNFIVEEIKSSADNPPKKVIFMGDFVSMNCFSEWDKNKLRKMEGKRYELEVQAGNTALDLVTSPSKSYYESREFRQSKSNKVQIEWIFLKGNHEERVDRYIDQYPVLADTIDLCKSLHLSDRKFKVVDYGTNYNLHGVSFTHIPFNSNGKPISNPNVCQKALRLYNNSVVFGHCHTLDHSAEYRHNAKHLNQALCVGGFFENVDDYAIMSKNDYWRGIVILNIYSENRFDIETVAMSRILKYA